MNTLQKTASGRPYITDHDAQQITFLDQRFYRLGDNFYPSVTTVLNAFPKGEFFERWLKENGDEADTIRDDAGRRGSIVHRLTEDYDNGITVSCIDDITGEINIGSREWSMFERYVDFTDRFTPTHDVIEATVIDPLMGVAGTVDRISVINGVRYIVDIKTSNNIHDTYWMQLAAYREMLVNNGTEVDAVAILWLNAKTKTNGKGDAIQGKGWQMVTRTDTASDLELFRTTKLLWDHVNADIVPRDITYKISHTRAR